MSRKKASRIIASYVWAYREFVAAFPRSCRSRTQRPIDQGHPSIGGHPPIRDIHQGPIRDIHQHHLLGTPMRQTEVMNFRRPSNRPKNVHGGRGRRRLTRLETIAYKDFSDCPWRGGQHLPDPAVEQTRAQCMANAVSHDQNFKNLILDYPRDALAFFATEEAPLPEDDVEIIPAPTGTAPGTPRNTLPGARCAPAGGVGPTAAARRSCSCWKKNPTGGDSRCTGWRTTASTSPSCSRQTAWCRR